VRRKWYSEFFLCQKKKKNKLTVDIFRKPTVTDTNIDCNLNHPVAQKLAAYRFLVNMMHQLLLSQGNKKQEKNSIYHIAWSNSYPISIITKLNNKLQTKNMVPDSTTTIYLGGI
jgi:hypothetical protein